MATAWEYRRVGIYVTEARQLEPGYDLKGQAEAGWVGKLNEMGAEGWELISEHFAAGGHPNNLWVEYRGVMKRPQPAQ
jgi:hypothetical protein